MLPTRKQIKGFFAEMVRQLELFGIDSGDTTWDWNSIFDNKLDKCHVMEIL